MATMSEELGRLKTTETKLTLGHTQNPPHLFG
jgi:hypothetical protein